MSISNIEWTDATWNPIAGCTPVSPGCLHCYAATMSHRLDKMGQKKYRGLTVLRNGIRTFNGKIGFDEEALAIPLKRKKPAMYFVNSMSDLFHEAVPFEFVDRVFAVMALCPQHTFQILTKRPERMAEYLRQSDILPARRREDKYDAVIQIVQSGFGVTEERRINLGHFYDDVMPNVWLGTSCEDQHRADERIPHLLKCPAAVRFLSLEPLLGPITLPTDNLRGYSVHEAHAYHCEANHGGECDHKNCPVPEQEYEPSIDWIIIGGESGGGARPCNVEWIRDIVRQCDDAAVPCFVKQLGRRPVEAHDGDNFEFCDTGGAIELTLKDKKGGDMSEWPADLKVRQFPAVTNIVEAR